MAIPAVVSLILALLGLVALLGSAYAVLKASNKTASVNLWREEAEAQKARADRLETALAEIDSRVRVLEAENARLVELATGRVALEALTALIQVQHVETLSRLEMFAHGK